MNREPNQENDVVTAIKDVLTSLIILSGALIIEAIKRAFEPPTLALITLNLLEITTILTFAVSFVGALISLLKQLKALFEMLSQLGLWRAIQRIGKAARPDRISFSNAFKLGLISSVLVAAYITVTLLVANAAVVWILGIVLALFLLGALGVSMADHGSQGTLDSASAFATGIVGCAFLVIGLLLVAPVLTGLALKVTGNYRELAELINNVLHK